MSAVSDPEPEFLTVGDVARLLRVSRPTVAKAVREQGLPAIRVSSRVLRFARVDVERWIREQKGGRNGGSAA